MPALTDLAGRTRAGVRKPAGEEPAGRHGDAGAAGSMGIASWCRLGWVALARHRASWRDGWRDRLRGLGLLSAD